MKKLLSIMLLGVLLLALATPSLASYSEDVMVKPYWVEVLPDGSTLNHPAQYVQCVYPSGLVTARSCNWIGYENKYNPPVIASGDTKHSHKHDKHCK
jgi:hypothetical protein